MNHHIRILTLLLALVLSPQARAQHADTLYEVRRQVVYDTIKVRDTVRIHDTLYLADYIHNRELEELFYKLKGSDAASAPDSLRKMWEQTVTFLEKCVLMDETTNSATMDSIRKYGVAGLLILGLNALTTAQTDSTLTSHHDNNPHTNIAPTEHPFDGFHFGYTLQLDVMHPITTQNLTTQELGRKYPLPSFHAGLEFSYNFADYFGVSAALNYGTLGGVNLKKYGFSLPLKFEFHYPVTPKILLTVSAGARLRLPIQTFITGFNCEYGMHKDVIGSHTLLPSQLERLVADADKNMPYADILLDMGLYYQLPNEDFLRFTTGINMATEEQENGLWFDISSPDNSPTPHLFYSHINHFLYFQMAYIHSFSKKRVIMQARPHWSTDEGMKYRHELRIEVGDPFGSLLWMKVANKQKYPQDAVGRAFAASPRIGINYHYRLSKWFWAGLSIDYTYAKDHTDYAYWEYIQERRHFITIMPELRFSYLNRPHVTLYSGLAAGITTAPGYHMRSWVEETVNNTKTFPSFQITALGIRAGRDHLFGTFEAGFGFKGFASLGIGYAF